MPIPIKINLTQEEYDKAVEIAKARNESNIKEGANHKAEYRGNDGEGLHVTGAVGELVVSKYLGVPWPHDRSLEKGGPDVVGGYEVRTTDKIMSGELPVRDNDNRIYIFVSNGGHELCWYVEGWIKGSFARSVGVLEARQNRTPAYFVYRTDLNSMSILPGKDGNPYF